MSGFSLPPAWALNGFTVEVADTTSGVVRHQTFKPLPPPHRSHAGASTEFPSRQSQHPPPSILHPQPIMLPSPSLAHPQPSTPTPRPTPRALLPKRQAPHRPGTVAVQSKRPRIDGTPDHNPQRWPEPFWSAIRENDALRDEGIAQLQHQEQALPVGSFQAQKAPRMRRLLDVAKVARPENTKALFGTQETVLDTLQDTPDFNFPVFFTADYEGQDVEGHDELRVLLETKAKSTPDVKVSVQNAGRSYNEKYEVEDWPLSALWERLESNHDSLHPVNVLEWSPDECITPAFLREFGFLKELARPLMNSRSKTLFKDPTSWATFAQVGTESAALTLPHRDVDGLDTCLQCVQGQIGFIWLENPSFETLDDYVSSPNSLPYGSQWRIAFLRPGQAVYLPAGLVHAVMRPCATIACPRKHTLIYGGHILRPERVADMARLCVQQMKNPSSVNEHEYRTAVPYLARIGQVIGQSPGNLDRCGGQDAVNEFWRISAVSRPLQTEEFVTP